MDSDTKAVGKYEEKRRVKTRECVFVNPDYPMLVVSPDRVKDEDTLLGVKCPKAAKGEAIDDVSMPYLQSVDFLVHILNDFKNN